MRLGAIGGRHRVSTWRVEAGAALSVGLGALRGGCVPRGAGRSFGDAAAVAGGHTIETGGLVGIGRVEAGEITVEAGAPLGAVAAALDGTGWGLPVVGGTRHVTVGGAIAADIHGKNDVAEGSFGNHTAWIELALADGTRVVCGPDREPELFAATVGGMGLTGLVVRARLRLAPRPHAGILRTRARFDGVDGLMRALDACDAPWRAAWCDRSRGGLRGVLHSARPGPPPGPPARPLPAPLPRVRLYRRPLVAAVNARLLDAPDRVGVPAHLWDLVWSVDRLPGWAALHGRRGCEELQFACPAAAFPEALARVVRVCDDADVRPTFAMVKALGDHPRAGLLSFPTAGYTYTANFTHRPGLDALFRRIFEEIVAPAGGRPYLAKDAALTAPLYAAMTPGLAAWRRIARQVDPRARLRSGLSRRLDLKPW